MADTDYKANISFSTLLASSVHDMKNSVGMLLFSLHDLLEKTPPQNPQQQEQFFKLEYEATRINNDLIQLLTLYRMDEKSIAADIDETHIHDLLFEQSARNESLLKGKNIELTIECDPALIWYLDAELIGSVINNLLVNAARYARSKINLHASVNHARLKIEIEDDGEGFPAQMLSEQPDMLPNRLVGSTQLGLLFAQCILALHGTKQNHGYMQLGNWGIAGGAKVELYLP